MSLSRLLKAVVSIPKNRPLCEIVSNHIRGGEASWLIVYDAAECPDQLEPVLVEGSNITALVTSTHRDWPGYRRPIELSPLDEEAAVRLLASRSQSKVDCAGVSLVRRLGYLPFAVVLAGATCRERSVSFETYLAGLEDKLVDRLQVESESPYDELDAVWSASIEAIGNVDPSAVDVMELLCVLNWEAIDRGWLTAGLGNDPQQTSKQLSTLAAHSLIKLEEDSVAVTHRIVADGIGARVGDGFGPHLARVIGAGDDHLNSTEEFPSVETSKHVRYVLSNHPRLVQPDMIELGLKVAGFVRERLAPGSDFEADLVSVCEDLLEVDDPSRISALLTLASRLVWLGRFDQSLELLRENELDRWEDLNEVQLRTAAAVVYAQALVGTGESSEALGVLEPLAGSGVDDLRSLDDQELEMFALLGQIYDLTGRYEEAIQSKRAVLRAYSERSEAVSSQVLRIQGDVVESIRKAGRLDEALELAEELVEQSDRSAVADDYGATVRRMNLGFAYLEKNRLDEGYSLIAATAADTEALLGRRHPISMNAKQNLAKLLGIVGDIERAVLLIDEVVGDYEVSVGCSHPDALAARLNQSSLYRRRGWNSRAVDITRDLIADAEASLGRSGTVTMSARNNLALALSFSGETTLAVEEFRSIVADVRTLKGADHPDTLIAEVNLARVLLHLGMGELEEGGVLLRGAIGQLLLVFGYRHLSSFDARMGVAEYHVKTGRLGQGIAIVRSIVQDALALLGPEHPETQEIQARLAQWEGLAAGD